MKRQVYMVKFLDIERNGSKYRYNRTAWVAAYDAVQAITAVAKRYEGCRVDAVIHHGEMDIICDDPNGVVA